MQKGCFFFQFSLANSMTSWDTPKWEYWSLNYKYHTKRVQPPVRHIMYRRYVSNRVFTFNNRFNPCFNVIFHPTKTSNVFLSNLKSIVNINIYINFHQNPQFKVRIGRYLPRSVHIRALVCRAGAPSWKSD